MEIAIIGAGAAGFFAAICAAENHPDAGVSIYEKSKKYLAKVRISGGGRCNVTNVETSIAELAKAYPRGGKKMKKLLSRFSTSDTIQWFTSRGVELYAQDDGRMFPVSDSSETIINLFLQLVDKFQISLRLNSSVEKIQTNLSRHALHLKDGQIIKADRVIVATGGSPKLSGLQWLSALGHEIEPPVPSLFTFNMPKHPITKLMGLSVPKALVRIQSTKYSSRGPLLLTHWGMSGPAVLKLSALAARDLHSCDYHFTILVSWLGSADHDEIMKLLESVKAEAGQKYLSNSKPSDIPDRLWMHQLSTLNLPPDKPWSDLGKKDMNRICSCLCQDVYEVKGKTTFKEEFVTCGGVSLRSVDMNTMESKHVAGIYFAGEVLDIDGVTGGYNFQSAWTTAYIASQLKSSAT